MASAKTNHPSLDDLGDNNIFPLLGQDCDELRNDTRNAIRLLERKEPLYERDRNEIRWLLAYYYRVHNKGLKANLNMLPVCTQAVLLIMFIDFNCVVLGDPYKTITYNTVAALLVLCILAHLLIQNGRAAVLSALCGLCTMLSMLVWWYFTSTRGWDYGYQSCMLQIMIWALGFGAVLGSYGLRLG